MKRIEIAAGLALLSIVFGGCAGMTPEEFKAAYPDNRQSDAATEPTAPAVAPKRRNVEPETPPATKPTPPPTAATRPTEAPPSGNGRLSLAWDPSSDSDIAGYRVRYGTEPGKYTGTFNAKGEATATILGLVPGTTYYFVVVAYNRAGQQSAPSNEMSAVAK